MKVFAIVILAHYAATSGSTQIDYPADVNVQKTLRGSYKVFATSKGRDLPNVVNRISVI